MRALIIGCGYVGTALASKLLARGVETHAVRRFHGEEAAPALAALHWHTADITRPEELPPLREDWDVVINAVSSSRGGLEVYRRVFLEGTRYLLELFSSRPPGLYVQLSSTSVYGQTDGGWVTEDSPTTPASETARILVAAEQQSLQAAATGWPVVILRLAGIYGPGRCYWLQQFLHGQAKILGAGDRYLNMIHRDDVVSAILAVLDQKAAAVGRVFNVVDDYPVTQRELFGWLAEALQRPLPPAVSEEALPPRKRGLTHKCVSNARLKNELAWRPHYSTYREGFTEEIRRLQAVGELPLSIPPHP